MAFICEDNTRTIRKISIITVLKSLDKFAPFKKMNMEIRELHKALTELQDKHEKVVRTIKSEFQGK